METEEKNNIHKDKSTSAASAPPINIPLYAWKVLAVLSLVATMVMYAETMLIPAIPDLIKDFGTSYSMSSWILTAYLVSGAVMTPIAGKLSDIYGKKRILLIIMAIYTVGVSCAGFANNIYFMLVARAIQGIGIAMFPIAFSIIRDQFPREKISIGQGVITSMFASGAVIGLSVGGTIIQHFGWQATFLTIIPIAISLLIVIWRYINVNQNDLRQQQQQQQPFNLQQHVVKKSSTSNPNQYERATANNISRNSSNKTVDVKGALALAATITSFLLLLTFLETGNNVSSTQLLAMTVISLSLFIIVEKRATSPLIDFKIMLDKNLLTSNILIMIIGLSMFMVFQTIPVLVRSPIPFGFGDTASNVGNVQLPFALVLLVFGPSSGLIISKLGSLKPIIIGTIISAVGFIGILLLHQTEIGISVNLAILSAGLSLTSVGAMNVIILSTPRQSSGMSLGISSLMRIVGASIGPALAGMYMQSNQVMLTIGGMTRFFPSIESYNLIFLTAAIVSIMSVVMALLLRRRVQKMAIPNIF